MRRITIFLVSALAAADLAAQDATVPLHPQFAAFKALEGEWSMLDDEGTPVAGVAFTYVLSGRGSVVVETQFAGTPKEMMTLYHLDGDDLMLTHYCAQGNQPRMKARRADDAEVVEFDFLDGSNMDSATDRHMHSMRATFEGTDRVSFVWHIWQEGKQIQEGGYTLQRATAKDAATTRPAATQLLAGDRYVQYGEGAHQGETVAVARALADPGAHAGKPIRLSGDVVGVCLKKGCWMRIGTEEHNVHVRFKDYGFFVPVDTRAGVGAVLEGTLFVEEQSVEELRHYLEDAGKHEEAAKITEPRTVVSFLATGVALAK